MDAQTVMTDLQRIAEAAAEREFYASAERIEAAQRQQWQAQDVAEDQFFGTRRSVARVHNPRTLMAGEPWERQVYPRRD